MILIKNGLVKTMAGEDIENGQVLLDGDKIAAVGKEVSAPVDAQVIDAAGCIVAPGFVEGHCHIGLDEEAIGFEGDDYNEMTDPVTPQMRGIDGLNPMDEAFFDAYSHGVTTAVTGPGSANVVGGTFLAVKLCGKRVDNMVVKNPVAMKIAFGENPKRCYGASQKKMPMTRMGTAALLRELLVKAQNYREEMDAYEADPKNNKKPTYDCKLHAMLPVMRKEIPLKSHAHRADDIFTSLRIAKEFDLNITLDHCTEGHLIADELEKEGKGCLVGPTFGAKSKFELKNKCWDTPKTMVEHGLKTAIITDAPVIPLKYLPLCAGLAINAGLDEQEAWKAVTINPAVITGIADRVGSLEVGKDADVVIYNGNPLTDLQYTTKYTLINGQIVYQAE
ncbi:amidohydrolase [Intestinimonas sp. MSJ-38]|uniref:amidohydrolase n=1 Tax=Intestinimonas sp. MSJ-38 TaxID=2841532 RepID=UPI001C11EE6E|nr:amidohydrolase [Intestinimonas sp. MSJ-38]MBU5433504.1 amidohydrolase [Intestinimonas sp. MSJ-38]